MPIKYDELMALKNLGQKYAYGDREVMLYAYGIGMGADPMDEKELAFVNEAVATPRALKVVPTFASVAAWGANPGEMNLNRVMVVDGERDITFHKPLPVAAHITADSTVLARVRQGQGQGRGDPAQDRAAGREGRGTGDAGRVAFRARRRRFWRAVRRPARTAQGADAARRTDRSISRRARIRRWSTGSAATAIRCIAIRNSPSAPVFRNRSCTACAPTASPAAASCRPMPITTPSAFKQHAARFSSPVYPGETVTMDLWKDGNVISFEAKVKARNVTVIKSGRTVLG